MSYLLIQVMVMSCSCGLCILLQYHKIRLYRSRLACCCKNLGRKLTRCCFAPWRHNCRQRRTVVNYHPLETDPKETVSSSSPSDLSSSVGHCTNLCSYLTRCCSTVWRHRHRQGMTSVNDHQLETFHKETVSSLSLLDQSSELTYPPPPA